MRYLDAGIIAQIKASNPIEEVARQSLDLTPRRNRYWGLCPFHQEKTPSFCINVEGQYYYCFGCRCAGDVIKFVMEYYKLGFRDSCLWLARRGGVVLSLLTVPCLGRKLSSSDKLQEDMLSELILERLRDKWNKLQDMEKWMLSVLRPVWAGVEDPYKRPAVIQALKMLPILQDYLDKIQQESDLETRVELAEQAERLVVWP